MCRYNLANSWWKFLRVLQHRSQIYLALYSAALLTDLRLHGKCDSTDADLRLTGQTNSGRAWRGWQRQNIPTDRQTDRRHMARPAEPRRLRTDGRNSTDCTTHRFTWFHSVTQRVMEAEALKACRRFTTVVVDCRRDMLDSVTCTYQLYPALCFTLYAVSITSSFIRYWMTNGDRDPNGAAAVMHGQLNRK